MSRFARSVIARGVEVCAIWLVVWALLVVVVRLLIADPATLVAGPLADEATRAHVSEQLALDSPVALDALVRGVRMLGGDWGSSLRTGEQVTELLAGPILLSLSLAVCGAMLGVLLSASIIAIARDKGWGVVIVSLAATPSFVWGLWASLGPLPDLLKLPRYGLSDGLGGLVLPVVALSIPSIGVAWPRLGALAQSISQAPWYRASIGHGLSAAQAVRTHGLPHALAGLGDVFAQLVMLNLTGAIAVEYVFGLPGLGTVVVDAVQAGDIPVVYGVVAVTVAASLVVLLARSSVLAGTGR